MRRRMCFAKPTIAASATSDSWSNRSYAAASAAARYSRHPKSQTTYQTKNLQSNAPTATSTP